MFRFARIRPVTDRALLGAVSLFFYVLTPAYAFAASCEDYTATPPFLTSTVKPNVLFMLDNSGSMKEPASNSGYQNDCSGSAGTGFTPGKTYYGIFDSSATYEYNATIPVDLSPYDGSADAPYNVTDSATGASLIDATATGAFVEAACMPGVGVNCWQGNFLNWLTTRKIDAARKVLVGGKVESRSGYDYLGDGSTSWKIVGNNETSDRSVCKAYASGQTYSPYPDSTKFHLFSPADQGQVKALYDPYAKLEPVGTTASAASIIHDKNGVAVGEFGQVTNLDHNPKVINFTNSYTNPIVVVKPPSINGGHPATVRVSAVTAASFTMRIQEWKYLDGSHTYETVSYFVFEAGAHTFSEASGGNDITLRAGSVNVSNEVNNWDTVSGLGLAASPVVLASVASNNDSTPVTTRIRSISSSQFQIALQEEQSQASQSHAAENVHYIAVEPGQFLTDGGISFSAGKQSGFSSSWKSLSFGFPGTSAFIADMQTTNDSDTATLRYKNLTATDVEIMVEEEKSADAEITHASEQVGYLAVGVPQQLYNVALVVTAEPKGLVHEISEKVRTGVSFYRYQRDSDIYNGEWANGGTLRFSIPANPFVKNTTDISSYRLLETPIKSTTEEIVDAIEHQPLVWGTTPLAENLYEVGRYFSQIAPFYDDKPNINNETSYMVNNDWDPYYYTIEGASQLVRCAKSYVIVLSDGEPYRDDYVPSEIVGLSGTNGDDYDGDNNNKDCSKTGNTSNDCQDNLDDVANYLYWDNINGTYQDLRTETDAGGEQLLSGEQHLEIFTVAFGSNTIPQILQDTADNANGIAYAAEDGEKLAEVLTSAITAILKRTSAGSSVSVLSERATTGALINQAVFYPEKTFVDGGNTFEVSWLGELNAYWFYNSKTVSNIRENTVDPSGYYTLDIFDDKILDFEIDDDGSLKIKYYKAINEGSYNDGAADPDSGPGGTAGPEGVHQSLDDVKKIFEPGAILKDRAVEADPDPVTTLATRRYIYAVTETGSVEEFVQSNSSEFDNLFNLIATDIPTCLGTVDTVANKNAAANNLISYIRGASDDFSSQANIDEACRNRVVDNSGNIWKLGDIIYSTPKVENYDTGSDKFSLLFTGANDGMLHAFKLGSLRKDKAGSGQSVALCDSNTGNCTNTEIGDEAWSFIPRNAMPYLKYLTDPEYKHIYTVDLTPYILESGGKKILIGGMRLGGATGCTYKQGNNVYWCGDTDKDGDIDVDADNVPLQAVPPESTPSTISASTLGLSSYFALDVTDPYNPVFLWEFTDPSMGYSYSGPAVITRKIGGVTRQYVMFISGPLSSKGGAAAGQDLKIYILKLNPNTFVIDQVFKLDGNDETGFTKESAISNLDTAFGGRLFTNGLDYNEDGSTDAVFFGVNWQASNEWKGNVFLVAPTDDDPITDPGGSNETINWEIGKVFNQGQEPITAKIEHGSCYDNNYIYFGSGRWFYKTDTPGQNANDTSSLWGIEIDDCLAALSDADDQTKCTSTLNRAHNGHIGDDLCAADGTLDQSGEISWQLKNEMEPKGGDYFMERTITDPTVSSDIAFFTTMQPSSDLCSFGGRTRIWAFNCRTGHNIWDGCSNSTSEPPPGAMLLHLSGGNIEDAQLNQTKFSENDNLTTEWYKGVPPESPTPFVPYTGKLNGEILLWIER